MQVFENLYLQIIEYDEANVIKSQEKSNDSWFGLFSPEEQTQDKVAQPKSLYIWGGTGCGKTFMMDLFFDHLPIRRKRRVHFNNFMIDVHKRLHKLKMSPRGKKDIQLIDQVTSDLIDDAYVICFDEFQVTDIADALILKSLVSSMLKSGAILIATSNRPPNDLYKNGLQRSLFVPFIDLLNEKCDVHSLSASAVDYRVMLSEERTKNAYLWPINKESSDKIAHVFDSFRLRVASHNSHSNSHLAHTHHHSKHALTDNRTHATTLQHVENNNQSNIDKLFPIESLNLLIYGHVLPVKAAVAGRRVALFSFEELCSAALGPADYIALAEIFHVIVMTNVPVLNLHMRNEMRRFITCIDAMYEGQVHLVLQAAASPLELFAISAEDKRCSVFDEVFACDRTVSRLLEMQSAVYIQTTDTLHLQGVTLLKQIVASHCETSDGKTEEGLDVAASAEGVVAGVSKCRRRAAALLNKEVQQQLWAYYCLPLADAQDQDGTISHQCWDVAVSDVLSLLRPSMQHVQDKTYTVITPPAATVFTFEIFCTELSKIAKQFA